MSPLHAEVGGKLDGSPIVLLHGFTQTARLWGEFGDILGRTHRLVQIDLPGHGGSPAEPAGLAEGADLVASATRDALGDRGPFAVLGYSLGGRYGLRLAIERPEEVARLVLIGATAGIDDPALAANRRIRDGQLADRLESSGDLEGFLRDWLGAPMFRGLGTTGRGWTERLRNTPAGLATSLRAAGAGFEQPVWHRLASVVAPTLVLAGANDHRFVAHGTRLASAIGDATFSVVPGARHAAHLHQPTLTARLVASWLGSADP